MVSCNFGPRSVRHCVVCASKPIASRAKVLYAGIWPARNSRQKSSA
jgi:hypothetical protein